MSIHNADDIATTTVSNITPDTYQREMQTRLREWHSNALEPKLQGRQYLPLIILTVVLPIGALIVGWFL
jgi:hypothetical protein